MRPFEVSARMKVREGQLDGFKRQASECIRLTRERDTSTLRYDWYLNTGGAEAEIREAYVDSDGFLEHRKNIGEALDVLFSRFAEGHTAFGYGDASDELVAYATANMPPGSVKWYRFIDGFEATAPSRSAGRTPRADREGANARGLAVSVRMRVREGQLAGLEEQAARCVSETREKDTKTLQYNWFVSSDGTEAEIREAYVDSEGVIEHRATNVADATNEIFSQFADEPVVIVYGNASPGLKEFAGARMGDAVRWFSFLQGLDD